MATSKKNIGLMYGLICGGISILFSLLLYMGGVKWFVHPLAWSGIALPIIVAVLGGLAQKKANGGFLTFSEALKVTFTIMVIGSLIATVFSYVLFNIIDVPFREALSQEAAEASARWMEKLGVSQENIDKATTEMMAGNNYNISKLALNFAFGCILWFLFSLIIAAIIKKKKPEFDNDRFNR
jgi:Protein of unknown function (DUF4199)